MLLAALSATCRKRDEPTADTRSKTAAEAGLFEVVERSEFPDPRTSDYADCLFTARLRVLDPNDGNGAKIVIGVIPAFRERKLQPGSGMRPGDKIRGTSIPFDKAPENLRRMQTADRFGDYLTEMRLLPDVRIIEKAGTTIAPLATPSLIVAPAIPPDRFVRAHGADAIALRRKARIETEVGRIRTKLKAHGGTWEAWMNELRGAHGKLEAQSRLNDFNLTNGNLHFTRLPFHTYEELCADDPHTGPVGALRLLNAELHRLGIDLLVVPFPAKEDVNAHRFLDTHGPEDELNPQRLRFHLHLLEQNIEVLDLTPALRRALDAHEFIFFNNRDPHPVDGGIQVAGREIANLLRDYGLGAREPLPVEPGTFTITDQTPGFIVGAKYPAARVVFPGVSPVPASVQRRVIFQGDSFLHVPSRFVAHATIADHSGRYLGFKPDRFLREAGANLILQDLARMPRAEFAGRKVLVFVFGPTRLRSPRAGLSRADHQWHLALLPD